MSKWTYRFAVPPDVSTPGDRMWFEDHSGATKDELLASVLRSLEARGVKPNQVVITPLVKVDIRRVGKDDWSWDVFESWTGEHRAGGFSATKFDADHNATLWLLGNVVVGVNIRAWWDLGGATAEARRMAEKYPGTPIAVVVAKWTSECRPQYGWRFAGTRTKQGDMLNFGTHQMLVVEVIRA